MGKPPPKDDLYGDLLGSSEIVPATVPAGPMPGPMPAPPKAKASGLLTPAGLEPLPGYDVPLGPMPGPMAAPVQGPPPGVDLDAAEAACMEAIAAAEYAVCGPGSDGS